MKKISIAMTTYNGEKYIEKQLTSILNQLRKVDEVVICDDSSSDNTVPIVRNFIQENKLSSAWRINVNETNLGVNKNFFKCISMCTGNVLVMCDQDDIWKENYILEVEKIFESGADVKVLNVSYDYINNDDNVFEIKKRKGTVNNNLIPVSISPGELRKISFDLIVNKNISPGMTMSFDSEIKELYLKDSQNRFVHDWEINCLGGLKKGLFFYNMRLVKYRIHSSNACGIGDALNSNNAWNRFRNKVNDWADYIAQLKSRVEVLNAAYLYNDQDISEKIFIERFYKFVEYREKVVYKRSFLAWLKEIFYLLFLLPKTVDYRGCIIDFIYLAGLKKL